MTKRIRITNLGPNQMCRNIWGHLDPAFPTTIRDDENVRHVLTGKPIFFQGSSVILEDFDGLYEMDAPSPSPPNISRPRMFAEENSYYPLDRDRPSFEQMSYERSATHEASIQHANRQASRMNDRGRFSSIWMVVVMGVIVLMTIIFAIIALSLTFTTPPETARHASSDPQVSNTVISPLDAQDPAAQDQDKDAPPAQRGVRGVAHL